MICPSCKEDKLGTFVKQFIIAGLLPTRPFPTKVLNERYVCIECFRESNRSKANNGDSRRENQEAS